MPSFPSAFRKTPDVAQLEKNRDVGALIKLLAHRDYAIQWKAGQALERLPGEVKTTKLISALDHPDRRIRLGVVELLSDLHDIQAVPGLLLTLSDDENNEVRWASAITLGEIGDEAARSGLVRALKDPDKYVRYGAALSLEKNRWIPAEPEGQLYFLAAAQRWGEIPGLANAPVAPLIFHLNDFDPAIRTQAVKTLGELHDPEGKGACDLALRDISGSVRWEAIKAFPKCDIPLMHLPRGLSRRKLAKDPIGAMILNFIFIGLGYSYLGMWWGFMVFQISWAALLSLFLFLPEYIPLYVPLIIWFSSSFLVVLHTREYVRGMPDL